MHTLVMGEPGSGKATWCKERIVGKPVVVQPHTSHRYSEANLFRNVDRFTPGQTDALITVLDTAPFRVFATAYTEPHDHALLDRFTVQRRHEQPPFEHPDAFTVWAINEHTSGLSLRRANGLVELARDIGWCAALADLNGESPTVDEVVLRAEWELSILQGRAENITDLRELAKVGHKIRALQQRIYERTAKNE